MATLTTRIEEVTALTLVLVADLAEAVPDLATDRHRRAYVRAAFAMAEGVLSGLKGILGEAVILFDISLLPGEAAILAEESYSLKEDGSVRVGQSFLRLSENVRFVFAIGAKALDGPFPVDYSGLGWAGFKQSIKVRNRLVHPKSRADLVVSDEEMQMLDHATAWYRDATVRLMLQLKDAILARKGQLE